MRSCNFTKKVYLTIVTALLLVSAFSVNAQTYLAGTLQSGKLASAVAVDASGNVYVMQFNSASGTPDGGGGTGEVVKYAANNLSGSPTVIATGIPDADNAANDYATGIVVDPINGDVYVVSDNQDVNNTAPYGIIYKLANNGNGTYTKSAWITGNANLGYPSAIAIDASGNLYVDNYNGVNNNYEIDKYTRGSTTPTALYQGLDASQLNESQNSPYFYAAPTGLAVNSDGSNIYVTEDFDDDGAYNDQGHIDKLTKGASSYTLSHVSNGFSATGLALDASGNLFALQTTSANTGTGATTSSDYNPNYGVYEYPNGGATQSPTKIYTPLHSASADLFPFGIAIINDNNIFVTDGQASGGANSVLQIIGTPTTQASNVSFSNTTTTGTTINWTSGNGSSRAVFMAAASTGTPAPVNAAAYTANASFSSGAQIGGTGWYCVYNGTGTSVNVTNLSAATTYRAMVVEYNGGALANQNYLTSTATNNPNNVTTVSPTITTNGSPSALSTTAGTASSSTSFTVSGTNLTANVTATAPSGFDISLDNSTWSTSGGTQTITESSGSITNQSVYVRLDAGDAANTYSGNVALTSSGATTVNVAIPSSTVSAALPVVTTTGGTTSYTGTAVAVDGGITVSDAGSTNLASATVTIGSYSSGDILNFIAQNGISAAYSAGTLTLSGTSTVANYQSALRSITFSTTSASTTSRTISFVVNDGTNNSNTATKTISVAAAVPAVTSVAVTAGTYGIGQIIPFQVNMSLPVTVTGTPQIPITIGTKTTTSSYVSGSGTSTLTFDYTVVVGDNGSVGIGSAINLNGGTIQSTTNSTNAILTLNNIGSTSGVIIDGQYPSAAISHAFSTLLAGQTGTVTITFTEAVKNFSLTDLVVTNGALSNLVTTDNQTYTATLTPAANTNGTGTITISNNTNITDVAGNAFASANTDVFNLNTVITVTISPTSLPVATVGISYNQTLTASGGTASYTYNVTAGNLPAGLTLASNGALTGTPTAGGTFNFTITATDAGSHTGSQAYTLTVNAPTIALSPASLPAGTVGSSYSQSVIASGGTSTYTYAVTAGTLPAGLSLNASTGVISGTPTAGGSFSFTITGTDSSTGTGPYTGSQAYTLTVTAPTITLSPSTLTAATVGASYSQSVTASGGTSSYTYAVTAGSLPAGLSLSSSGTLSGTPTAGGTFNFNITATDASTGAGPYTGTRAYSLTVTAPTIVLSPSTLPNAAAGVSYSHNITASGGTSAYTYAVTAGALPTGLSFNSSTGVISGTPTANGTFNFSITATDASTGTGPYTGTRAYAITVTAPTIVLSPSTLPNATAGVSYNQALSASGGTSPYIYSVTAGALPAGLSFNSSTGVLSGTPTAVGSFSFTITATDAGSFTGSQAYTLTVNGPTLTQSPTSLSDAVYGSTYTPVTFTVTGGTAPYTYSATGLPPGMTINANTGTLSGKPTAAGTYSVAVTATDNTTGTGAPFQVTNFITWVVDKVPLTITPNNATMVYGGGIPALNVTYSGFVNGDNSSSLTTAPTVSTTATSLSPVNTYPITASGAVDPNYSINYGAPATLTITPAQLDITANNATMVYGGSFPLFGVTYSGFVNGDNATSLTVQPAIGIGATPSSPVGTYPLTPQGAVDPNYVLVYHTGSLSITAASLTITASDASMAYGGSVPALSAAYSGFVNGDNVSSLTTLPTLGTTATSASVVGTYPITASGAVDPNYTITYVGGTMTVGKAVLTVTADNKTMQLGGPLPAFTVSYSGFVNGDGASSLTTQPTASTTASAGSPAGNYTITASGGSSPNYTFSYVNGTLTVQKAILTITAINAASVYGSSLVPNGSLSVNYSGFINGDGPGSLTVPPTVTNTAFAGGPVGSYALIPSGAVDPNYTIVYVNGTYNITPASLNITAVNVNKTYGAAMPALSATYSGFVNGDNASSLTVGPVLTVPAIASSPAGTYPITPSGAVDPNYNITYANGTLTVTPASLTITANNGTMTYGDPVPTLTASYNGFVNGDIASSLTTQPSLTTMATSASATGTYTVTASGAVDANYTITYVPGVMTVGTRPVTVTANAQSKIYGAPDPALTFQLTSGSLVNGDAFSGALSRVPGESVGTYAINQGTLALNSNYALTYNGANLTITAAQPVITLAAMTKTYGDADFDPGATSTNTTTAITYTSDNTAVATIVNGMVHIVGAGTANITAAQAASTNYSAGTVTAQLTVNKLAIAVTANAQSKIYGDADPALTYTFTPALASGDSFSGALARAAGESVGTYAITQGTLALNSNYTLTFTGANLTITTRAIAVTANAQTKVYGDADPALTYQISTGSLVGSDAFSGALTRDPGENVGTYAINQGTLALNSNYSLTYTGANLTITPATATLALSDLSQTYDGTAKSATVTVTPTGLSGVSVTYNGSTTTPTAAGSYAVIASLTNPNYTAVNATGTLVINDAAQVITFAALPTKTYGDADFAPGATSSNSGIPITYTSSNTAVATIVNGNIHIVGAGSSTITASQAGDANHTAAASVNQTLTVGQATLTITAANQTRPYGQPNPTLTVNYSGFVNGDAIASLTSPATASTTATMASAPGQYPITVSGAVGANYTMKYVSGTLTVTPLHIATLAGLSISAGTLSPAFSPSVTSYTTIIDAVIGNLGFTAIPQDPNATVTINGIGVMNGSAYLVPVSYGNNLVSITVTAQDGVTQQTYTVEVTRKPTVAMIKPTNILTPNGDGVNDTWQVPQINLFPDNYVQVYDRGGRRVYYKKGYTNDWGGTVDNHQLSEGTYYYVVFLGAGLDMIYGYITILNNH